MNGCEERAGRLAECLEDINGSLVELCAVFQVKRQVLAGADMEALDELLAREATVAEALFDAESRREVLVEDLAAQTGACSKRLVDVAAALPEGSGQVLLDAGIRLKSTVATLVREARIVATICQAAIEHYEKLIRIISGAEITGPVYTAGGCKTQAGRTSIIDQAI